MLRSHRATGGRGVPRHDDVRRVGGVGAPIEECRRILDAYADAGGNVVDTAINYQGGTSEEILGELLAGRRDRLVLASKYSVTRDRDDPNGAGNHRKNLRLSPRLGSRRALNRRVSGRAGGC